jgi:hypothetical protein
VDNCGKLGGYRHRAFDRKLQKQIQTEVQFLMDKPIKEGREILMRALAALIDAPECYVPVRGPWVPLSDAQTANWDARQTISKLLRDGSAELEAWDAEEEERAGIAHNAEVNPAAAEELKEFDETREHPEEPAFNKRVLVEAKQSNLFS